MRKPFRNSLTSIVAGCAALIGLGCSSSADRSSAQHSAIIGGTLIDVTARRSLGLVDSDQCSNSLIERDWVLTAGHCLYFGDHTYGFPRSDGTLEWRELLETFSLGTSDLTLVHLQPLAADSEWPSIPRALYRGDPAALLGQSVTCYGKGAAGYDPSGSGLVFDGNWRKIETMVLGVSDAQLVIIATGTPGQDIIAPGDSGGPCFFDGELVAAVMLGGWTCSDSSTDETCRATISSMNWGMLRTVSEFATEIAARTTPAP